MAKPVSRSPRISEFLWTPQCRERGSNPHGRLAHGILSPARLPISPSRQRTRSEATSEAGSARHHNPPDVSAAVRCQLDSDNERKMQDPGSHAWIQLRPLARLPEVSRACDTANGQLSNITERLGGGDRIRTDA
jgi:hypothetical protein